MRNFSLSITLFSICCALGYAGVNAWDRWNYWEKDKELFSDLMESSQTEPSLEPSLETESDSPRGQLNFEMVQNTGISFEYENGSEDEYHLAETLGGGVGVFDFDNDGQNDLVFVDGGTAYQPAHNQGNHLMIYRGLRDIKFQDVTTESSLNWEGYGHGCIVGDVNNDGFDDLFVTGYLSTGLFLNQGDGTFQETTETSGLSIKRWNSSAAFCDLDSDGDVDLYVTGYADTPPELPTPVCRSGEQRIHCHPHHYHSIPDSIFENLGDGTFIDRSETTEISQHQEYGLGVVITDLNYDSLPDIFVANDGDRNLLFQNKGNWDFEEIALVAGVAYNSKGRSMGSMGIACADFTNDGTIDLLTTNFSNERNVLFENIGDMLFRDSSLNTPIDRASRSLVGWAAIPIDVDYDGYMDLFVTNGHVTKMPEEMHRQPAFLMRGLRGGAWENAHSAGDYFQQNWHGRGAAKADFDGDYRDDLVVSHINDRPSILKNRSGPFGNRIVVSLIGVNGDRNAISATINYKVDERLRIHQVKLNNGYLCSEPGQLILGIGDAARITDLTIDWPSGERSLIPSMLANTKLEIIEGGETFTSELPN
ncbi:CRTAC1 family protein [Planctomycetaceae bacterium]|nr:CRTAC1 family protein [bacterium]MDB4679450.1 CRTAC1 family protein [Planctomycetaceae bacterium]MDC0273805.1 CRTAC1 family protein [Planctomycetaceae bacterium]